MQDLPQEVLWYHHACIATGGYVGSELMAKLTAIENKYPEHFPWEAKYRAIPDEVHKAYKNERWTEFMVHVNNKDQRGLMEMINEEFEKSHEKSIKTQKELEGKSLKEMFEYAFNKMESDRIQEQKERKSRLRKDKALWDKYYKKYGLEFREL